MITEKRKVQAGQVLKPQNDPDAVYIRMQLQKGDVADSHAVSYRRKSLEHYRDAGTRLAEVRDKCKRSGTLYYRKWLKWLEENGIEQQRASECIRLAEGWPKLPPGGGFGLKEALAIISLTEKGQSESPAKDVDGASAETQRGEENAADSVKKPRTPAAKAARRGAKVVSQEERGYTDDGSAYLHLGPISKEVDSELCVKLTDLMGVRGHGSTTEAAVEAIRDAHKRAMKCPK